jgi:segregation and condensation protein B
MAPDSEVMAADETDTPRPTPSAGDEPTEGERLTSIIESVLFAAGAPVTVKRLVEILAGPRGSGPKAKDIQQALARLQQDYAPGKRGIHLHEVGGGYQLRTARENAQWVRAVFRDKPARLGRAALETLAIVAYKQPATRADIESVRGVDAEAALSTLLDRRLVKIVGRKDAVGRPLLYATTPEFLEAFGLNDLRDLPSLKELGPVPDAEEEKTSAETGAEAAAFSTGDETSNGEPADIAGESEVAEAAQPGGNQLAAQGGGADRSGPGERERAGGDRAGDEGEPEDRPHHG